MGTQVGLGTPASSPLPGEPWHPPAPLPPPLPTAEERPLPPARAAGAHRPPHQGLPQPPLHHRLQPHHPPRGASSGWGGGHTRVSWEDPGVREGTLASGGDPGVRGGDARIRTLMLRRVPPPQHELYIRAFQKLSEFPPVSVTPCSRVTPTLCSRVTLTRVTRVTLSSCHPPPSSSPPEADPAVTRKVTSSPLRVTGCADRSPPSPVSLVTPSRCPPAASPDPGAG